MENKLKKLYISLVFIFIYAPIFVLILYSFNDSKLRGSFTGITFKWYVELFNDKEVLRALYYTILIAVLTTVIAIFIGTVAAIGIYYMKKSEKFVVLNLNYIPVLNPDIVIAISLMVLYKVFNIDYGFLTLLASHIVLTTPYVILSVYHNHDITGPQSRGRHAPDICIKHLPLHSSCKDNTLCRPVQADGR